MAGKDDGNREGVETEDRVNEKGSSSGGGTDTDQSDR